MDIEYIPFKLKKEVQKYTLLNFEEKRMLLKILKKGIPMQKRIGKLEKELIDSIFKDLNCKPA